MTLEGTIRPKFVGYYKSKSNDTVVGQITISNVTEDVVKFSVTVIRRGKQKGEAIYNSYRMSPNSNVQYYAVLFLYKGDRIRVKTSKKGALIVTISGRTK